MRLDHSNDPAVRDFENWVRRELYGPDDGAAEQKASEWQSVAYRCYECGHTGECRCRIGEQAFCGQCGSHDLVKPKPKDKNE